MLLATNRQPLVDVGPRARISVVHLLPSRGEYRPRLECVTIDDPPPLMMAWMRACSLERVHASRPTVVQTSGRSREFVGFPTPHLRSLYKSSAVSEMGDRLATWAEKWGLLCPFCGELGSHLAMSLGPRPTSVPIGILIRPSAWPQQAWAENWGGGCAPFWGKLVSRLTQCVLVLYLHTKRHLHPSNRLATIHQRHRQTEQTTVR